MNTESHNKPLRVELTKAAERYLRNAKLPVLVEMELYFSCLIRKRVYFYRQPPVNAVALASSDDRIHAYFRPVMTRSCHTRDVQDGNEPDVVDFPLEQTISFTPHWLKLDIKHGELTGEYGF